MLFRLIVPSRLSIAGCMPTGRVRRSCAADFDNGRGKSRTSQF